MEWYNKTVCVTFEDLTEGVYAVMKYDALRQLLRRNPHLRLRRQGPGHPALIDYYALPLRYRQAFEGKLGGDPKALLEKESRKATLRLDDHAREFYASYTYSKGTQERVSLPEELVEEYTVNASVLNLLIERQKDCTAYRRALGGSASRVWGIVVETSEQLRGEYGHTLPANPSRLKDRMVRYRSEGYPSLISKKIGNRNTTVITEEAGRYIIALKRSRMPVYTDAQILAEYNRAAPGKGWKTLRSVRALSLFLEKPEIMQLWHDAVYGELKTFQLLGRKHRTELPQKRDALWYGDGTKLNLYYREMVGGRNVVRTTQVYEVIDAYSEVLLGYHISETEDYEAQYYAYRMAVGVAGHKPNELVCDNQGGHKKLRSQNFLPTISHIFRTTQPNRGQSKTIESVFGRFQSQVLHKSWFFTGQNITARKASSRANIEFINANVDKLPTLDELRMIYASCREEWNSMELGDTGMSRLEAYRSSINEDTRAVGPLDMVDMFWLETERPSTYTGNGIRFTIKGKVREYEVQTVRRDPEGRILKVEPDHEFLRNNYGRKFFIRYDPCDERSVRLYTRDADGRARFAAVAEPRVVIHRALQDQEEWEAAFIRQEQRADIEDRLERQARARAIEFEHGTAPEQNGLRRPRLAGLNGRRDAVEREIERRMKKYARVPIPIDGSKLGKEISLAVFNPQTGEIEFDERHAAGKL